MNMLTKKQAEFEDAVRAAEIDVRNKQAALRAAEQWLETTRARLEGFRVAMDYIAEAPASASTRRAVKITPAAGRQRTRQLTGHWQKIMQTVHGREFGYADLITAASLVGHQVGKETLRSQMSGYKKAGIVESAGEGLFRITHYGKEAAGISQEDQRLNENGEAEASPAASEPGASPDEATDDFDRLFS